MNGVLRYLRSGYNIVGLALALIGFLLHFGGLFGPAWPIVVVALYLVGLGCVFIMGLLFQLVGLFKPDLRPLRQNTDAFDPDLVRRSLDQAYQMTHGRLPADVQSQVARIRAEILDLLPHAAEFPTGSQELFVLQRTATNYLPESIQAYLALPADYATTQKVEGDKTPLLVLKDQLELLDTQMGEIKEAVRERDADRLLIQGKFLEERFGSPSSGLGLPPAESSRSPGA